MTSTIALPLWVALLLFALAAWALLDRLLVPSVRWVLRQRVNRALEEANRRLQIRLQPFKLTKRQVLIDRLLYDREVQAAAEAWAEARGEPRQVVMDRVERYAQEIVPSFNAYLYFRVGYWLSRALARTLYRVRLGAVDATALEAVDPSSTVVFVMNHRSNMDYVLVAYLVAERTALSYAVGEWARIWPLEQLVRSMGGYFVRRRSRNELYRAVLARYVHMATREGVTQAVYPEGGLSRDGRLQPPKLGILDYMVRGFDPAGERDLVFVPVGINYDRVLEDRTLLRDLNPEVAPRSRLGALWTFLCFWTHNFRLWITGRWYRFGYACVNFGRPLSMRAYCTERGLAPHRLPREERFAAVSRLADELMTTVESVVPVVPVALVAGVLTESPERSWSRLELKAAVQRRIDALEEAGRRVYVPREDRGYAIDVGLRMLILRRLVREEQGLFRARREEIPILGYYAASMGRRRAGLHRGRGARSVDRPPDVS